MSIRNGLILAALAAGAVVAQQASPSGGRAAGGFVPGQQRKQEDPAKVARGKALYGINCTSCHGADLRGGDMGGPNLLRSPVALGDKDGELIVPVIEGSRQSAGMPRIPVSDDDAKALAAYVRSVVGTIGRQGMPPGVGKEPPSILVGDAKAGQVYFAAHCAQCHSAEGDLKGLASRIPDPRTLQNTWVSGGGGGRRGRGPATSAGAPGAPDPRAVTATVKLANGQTFEGRVVRIDDFLVSLRLADRSIRSFTREGDVPKVEVHDPMKGHRDLLGKYTDKDIHDVTAYLVTLK